MRGLYLIVVFGTISLVLGADLIIQSYLYHGTNKAEALTTFLADLGLFLVVACIIVLPHP